MESSGNEQVAEDITEFMTVNDIDLTELKSLKGDNPKNPFLCYLNIKSLRYKIIDLRYILKQTGIAVSETKLSEEFPDSQFFYGRVYFPAYRRDRYKHGGGLIVFTKKDLITKRKKEFESTDDTATTKYANIVIVGDINVGTDNDKAAGLKKSPNFVMSLT